MDPTIVAEVFLMIFIGVMLIIRDGEIKKF